MYDQTRILFLKSVISGTVPALQGLEAGQAWVRENESEVWRDVDIFLTAIAEGGP